MACFNLAKHGKCSFGKNCMYSHDEEVIRKRKAAGGNKGKKQE